MKARPQMTPNKPLKGMKSKAIKGNRKATATSTGKVDAPANLLSMKSGKGTGKK